MKCVILFVAVLALFAIHCSAEEEFNHKEWQDVYSLQWAEYKQKYNKNYGQEDQYRAKIWLKNLKKVKEHNAKFEKGEVLWQMGMTPFSDMTNEEFVQKYTGVPKH